MSKFLSDTDLAKLKGSEFYASFVLFIEIIVNYWARKIKKRLAFPFVHFQPFDFGQLQVQTYRLKYAPSVIGLDSAWDLTNLRVKHTYPNFFG